MRWKATLPLWMESYQAHYGVIDEVVAERILSYSARTLERITFTHRCHCSLAQCAYLSPIRFIPSRRGGAGRALVKKLPVFPSF